MLIYVLDNPYVAKAHEYKGQIHFHSTGSDGVDSPTTIITAYRNAGYNFVCLTDHNTITPDPGVSGILFIPGDEESAIQGHIGSINPLTEKSKTDAQDIIDAIIADGGFVSMNHPNWTSNPWTDAELALYTDYHSIEIENANIGSGNNAEVKWDTLLTNGRNIFGTAVDDCHNIANPATFNINFVKVFADELTVSAIVESLKNGNFYSSNGATLSISVFNNTITATTDAFSKIEFIGSGGSILQTTSNATIANYTVDGDEVYVRVRITRNSDSKKAWSNPLFITELHLTLSDILSIQDVMYQEGMSLLQENDDYLLNEDETKILLNPTNFVLEKTEDISIQENSIFKLNDGYVLSLTDNQAITESQSAIVDYKLALEDSISITEDLITSMGFNATLIDELSVINDSIANSANLSISDLIDFETLVEVTLTEGKTYKSGWRFIIKNSSGSHIASLVNARKRWFVERLNDESEAGFILDVDDDNCNTTILNLGVNELHVYYEDTLKWAGQLVSAKKIASGNDIYWEVLAKDWVALLGKRFCGVEELREFTTTDAGQIAKTLIQETQALANGSFGITYGTIETSITRSPTYDKKNILEAIKELSNIGEDGSDSYGFDFEITPSKVFKVYYPYKGTIRNEIVFRYPGNCENLEAFVDSWGIVNHEWGLGQHWTGNTAIVSRSDATSQTTYKRREAIKNYRDMSVLNFLQDMVWQDIQWLKNPSTVVRFDARVDAKSGINDYNVGDGVSVICDKFDINEWLWVYERKVNIQDNDELLVTLTVGD